MEVSPYVRFGGRCEEAFTLYERVMGGSIELMMKYGQSPAADAVPPEWHDKIFHLRFVVNGQVIMGADSLPGEYEEPRGIRVSVEADNPEQAEEIFQGLARGGTVDVPMAETPWAHRFGQVTDAYGVPWIINCDREPYD